MSVIDLSTLNAPRKSKDFIELEQAVVMLLKGFEGMVSFQNQMMNRIIAIESILGEKYGSSESVGRSDQLAQQDKA